MLGSRLVNEKGEPVWDDLQSFSKRFLELEYPQGPSGGSLRPAGLMVKDFFLGDLRGGNYAGLLSMLTAAGFKAGEDLFVFAYDWRQSNFETARQLAEFVDSQVPLRGRTFNILAHSMGGLVAAIYVNRYADRAKVNNVITLATPYWGSLDALRVVLYGPRDIYNNVLSRLLGVKRSDVNRVLLSFPSLYEQMPSYEDCCTLGATASTAGTKLSVLDIHNWSRLGWLPAEYTGERQLGRIGAYMAAAGELRTLLQQPPPKGIRVHRIAGDLFDTNVRVSVTGYAEDYVWSRGPGDDTVWWPSALAGYAGLRVAARKPHNTIFDDTQVRSAVLNLLRDTGDGEDEVPISLPQLSAAGAESVALPTKVYAASLKREVILRRISMSIGARYKFAGSEFMVELRLVGENDRPVEGVQISAVLSRQDQRLDTRVLTAGSPGVYLSPFDTPRPAGMYEVRAVVPGFGELSESFAVAGEVH
jgi:pimeloyl-ACP methyl ester carboxylesterase